MEITEPVILDLAQGRKRVRLELTTRADARDLMKAVERCMERLPDDGEGLLALVEVRELPDVVEVTPIEQHAPHARDARLTPAELREQMVGMSEENLRYLLIHANGYCPAALNSALAHERLSRPSKPEPANAELLGELAGSIITGTPLVVTDDEPEDHPDTAGPAYGEAELRRADAYRAGEPFSLEAHRSVRLVRDGEKLVAVESTPCPETHPASGAICIGSVHHGPPCRTTDGDEWVPAPLAGAL